MLQTYKEMIAMERPLKMFDSPSKQDDRSLSVLLMLCAAQSERYFFSVPLNTEVSFEMKQNESIFDPV